MRYAADQKTNTRARIVDAVGRGFRARGYGGIGVDGLAKEAGVTSGAFYGHFPSKQDAFQEAVLVGLDDLAEAIVKLRGEHGNGWRAVFIDYYLGHKRICELDTSCALQSLTPDVQRSSPAMKSAFERRASKVALAVADGLPGETEVQRLGKAWALLSILTGAVTLARSVADEEVATAIAQSARSAALAACQ
jgi:TetR/AcrR family transcriptional regulator, transcriptional repressor for nem operon